MSYGIPSHKTFEGSIVKVGAIIADDSMSGSEARENILFQKLDDNFVVISLLGMDSTHLDTKSTATNMYWFLNDLGNGPIKTMSQTLNSSISRIGLRGIMFR